MCIAGFSVSTIARVGQDTPSSDSLPTFTSGGSLRWMSPELLDPSRLEDRDPRPTKESDCFALGMVTYEVRVGRPQPLLTFVYRTDRCYMDVCRMTGGRQKGSTMPYCKGFDRTSQKRQQSLGSWMNCGSSSSVAGKRNVRRDPTCGLSAHVWKKSPPFGTSGRICRRRWWMIPIRRTRAATVHALPRFPLSYFRPRPRCNSSQLLAFFPPPFCIVISTRTIPGSQRKS